MTTQQSHPWRAAARTAAQVLVAVPAALAAVAAVLVVVGETDALPPAWVAWAAGAAVTISALAGMLARIMALPAVDGWLAKLRLSSAPAGGPDDDEADAYRRGWLARDQQDVTR